MDSTTNIRPSWMMESNNGGRLELVAGFNSSRVLAQGFNKRPLPRRLLQDYLSRSSAGGTVFPQATIGRDDRVQIADTSAIPWRCICQLVVEGVADAPLLGTGWFAGSRTVITAGHNLVNKDTGRSATGIYVIPGRSGDETPYGFYRSDHFDVHARWRQSFSSDHDLGVVWLDQPIGERLGWFGIASYDNRQFRDLIVNTSGYPADKRLGTQWFNAGRVDSVTQDTVGYGLDTQEGQSGSPIFHYDRNDQRLVVAIHTYGYGSRNQGTRINEQVFDQLSTWIT